MTTTARLILVAAVGGMALCTAACGSAPIPTRAVAGTTITLAVPTSFAPGFGLQAVGVFGPLAGAFDPSLPYDPSSNLEDPQRGETLFSLYDQSGQLVTYLPVRYITRVGMAELTRVASLATLDHEQAVALLDIPPDVATGDYEIRLSRQVRSGPPPDRTFSEDDPQLGGQPWTGWGPGGNQTSIALHIEAGDGQSHFTPTSGWTDLFGNLAGQNAWSAMVQRIPDPSVRILLAIQDASATYGFRPSAAWSAEIQYPRKKVAIRGAALERTNASSALVFIDAEDPSVPVACNDAGGDTGSLHVWGIDPVGQGGTVRIAFELRNFDQACGGRVVPADFTIVGGSVHVYEADGSAATPTASVLGIY